MAGAVGAIVVSRDEQSFADALWRAVAPPANTRTERVTDDLLHAFVRLARRGGGAQAWVTPFRDDPLAFLLDTVSDATSLWSAEGDLLYCNRAAEELGMGVGSESAGERLVVQGRELERRCLRCHAHGIDYLLEITREVPPLQHPRR